MTPAPIRLATSVVLGASLALALSHQPLTAQVLKNTVLVGTVAYASQPGTSGLHQLGGANKPSPIHNLLPGLGGSQPMAAITEQEYNDSTGFANDVGILIPVVRTVNGTCGVNDKYDTFRFAMPTQGILHVGLTAKNRAPRYRITNVNGEVLPLMACSANATFALDLPKGDFCITIECRYAGAYTLSLSATFPPQPTIALGKKTVYKLTGGRQRLFKLVLPSDGRIKLTLNSTGRTGTRLCLLNSRWGYIHHVNNDSSSTSGDAGLNAVLPAGTYYLYIISDADTMTSVTATHTQVTIPTLRTSLTGNIRGGEEDFDLYRVVLTKTAMLNLGIAADGSTPISDSVMQVFDCRMGLVMDSDWSDDYNSSLSSAAAVFPPGVY